VGIIVGDLYPRAYIFQGEFVSGIYLQKGFAHYHLKIWWGFKINENSYKWWDFTSHKRRKNCPNTKTERLYHS